MSFGRLSPAQKRALKPFVARRVVHDLGAGDLELAAILLVSLRAAGVVAVEPHAPSSPNVPGIRHVKHYFDGFNEKVRTAFVSWPTKQATPGLVRILEGASTVIYLGHNFDGTACGDPKLWAHLCSRRVLAHEPHPMNTLIVYGRKGAQRDLLPEEEAALDVKNIREFNIVYGD